MKEQYGIFTASTEITGSLSGIVTLPDGYDKTKEKLPLIVFLHGAGERGDPSSDIEKVRVHGIPKYFCKDNGFKGLRVVTLSPQCPENVTWQRLVYPLMAYIKAAVKEYNIDEDRISITGLSMGGYGTWNMLTAFPHFFSCAAPICGGGVPWETRSADLKDFKIWAFHGIDDPAVFVRCSLDMVEAARTAGADVTFTTFDKVGHGSWVNAYEQTELIEWLAAQKRA